MSVRCNHTYKQTPRKGANFPDLPVVQPDLIIPENKLYQSEFLGSAARSVPHVQGDVINRKSIRRFSGLVWLWTGSASLRFSDWCRSLRESFPSSDYRKETWKEVTAGYMWHASVCIFTYQVSESTRYMTSWLCAWSVAGSFWNPFAYEINIDKCSHGRKDLLLPITYSIPSLSHLIIVQDRWCSPDNDCIFYIQATAKEDCFFRKGNPLYKLY